MKIVVIGGTGLIGSRLVTRLREQGHEMVAASAMLSTNSKNCVACTIEYGTEDFSISCS